MALVLTLIGITVPLVLAAWRGMRLAWFGGLAWGFLGLAFQKGDVTTAAVVFLVPPLIGLLVAAGAQRRAQTRSR